MAQESSGLIYGSSEAYTVCAHRCHTMSQGTASSQTVVGAAWLLTVVAQVASTSARRARTSCGQGLARAVPYTTSLGQINARPSLRPPAYARGSLLVASGILCCGWDGERRQLLPLRRLPSRWASSEQAAPTRETLFGSDVACLASLSAPV